MLFLRANLTHRLLVYLYITFTRGILYTQYQNSLPNDNNRIAKCAQRANIFAEKKNIFGKTEHPKLHLIMSIKFCCFCVGTSAVGAYVLLIYVLILSLAHYKRRIQLNIPFHAEYVDLPRFSHVESARHTNTRVCRNLCERLSVSKQN